MNSKDVKKEILDGIFRSKDGLSSNELTELLNTLIAVSKKEAIAEHEAFIREIIVRANLDFPLTKQELNWFEEGTDHNKCPEFMDRVLKTNPTYQPTEKGGER